MKQDNIETTVLNELSIIGIVFIILKLFGLVSWPWG
jgi:hypothetical protein